MNNIDYDSIIIAIVVSIISTVCLMFFYPEIPIYGIIGFFSAIFTVILPIASKIEIIIEWMKKQIEIKWLLLMASFFLLVIVVMNNYNQLESSEGKLKCVLPNGKPITIPYSPSEELIFIFPQISEIPFISIGTYATNGRIKSQFHNDTLDGIKYYYEIMFQNYFNNIDSNSGWMIRPLWGYDASKFTNLSFLVKGAKGGEKFGIKIKDYAGTEVKVEITEKYLESNRIDTRWQKVNIPLEHFLNVDRSRLHIISLYSDGTLSYMDSETIYITDFKLS